MFVLRKSPRAYARVADPAHLVTRSGLKGKRVLEKTTLIEHYKRATPPKETGMLMLIHLSNSCALLLHQLEVGWIVAGLFLWANWLSP